MRAKALLITLLFIPLSAHAALININTAEAGLLDTLPGIGPTKAAAIIDYREKNGPFAAIEDIQNVNGIGPTTFANIQDQITVGEVVEKPHAEEVGYKEVKAVEEITSTNERINEDGVEAPTTRTEPLAVGAAVSNFDLLSPWTLGLFGVIILAATAFIFL